MLKRLPIVFIVIAFALINQPAHAQTLTETDYWQQIAETRSVARTQPEKLAAQAERWEAIERVTLANGETVPLDHSYLVGLLRADPPDPAAVEDALDALLAARLLWESDGQGDALAALDDVLSQPEFQYSEGENPIASFFERLRDRVLTALADLAASINREIALVVIVIGSIVLGAIVTFVLVSLLRESASDAAYEDPLSEIDTLTSQTALTRAQETSSAGDYRSAVRYLYLSTLLILEERGLLRYDRSRTNREYLSSLRERPNLAAVFRDVTTVFDRVWYGFQSIDEATYKQYVERVRDLQRQR
ncbi:MAG: DUF4129 domain-containing protein [Chloroflexi bacterium]|nr:DUF4129 domain-containing protein [Chloroflexota bacterium]